MRGAVSAGSASSSWAYAPRDRNEVAENALTCELRARAGPCHHHLANGFGSADDRVYDPGDAGETILGGKEGGLDSGSKTRLTACPRELERHELLDASTL